MFRWQEFSQEDQVQLATQSFNLFKSTGNSPTGWVVRSKGSLLMSLIAKRMGQPFWEQLLRELLQIAADGPVQAEKVDPLSPPFALRMHQLMVDSQCYVLSERNFMVLT